MFKNKNNKNFKKGGGGGWIQNKIKGGLQHYPVGYAHNLLGGGSGGMLFQEIFNFRISKTRFGAISGGREGRVREEEDRRRRRKSKRGGG